MLGDSASELVEQFGTETFKAVHDSDQDGLVYFAGDGRIEYANRAALELFGAKPEIIGENIFELTEDDADELPVELIIPSDHFEKARETFEQGVPNRSEMVVIDGDERRELEVVWGPVEDGETVTGIVGSYRDVSPRPDIHDQLSHEASRLDEQRRFLASIIDVLDDGVLVFDGNATLRLANPAALDLVGLEPPVEGLELGDLLERSKLEAPERFSRQLRRTASSDSPTQGVQLVDLETGEMRRIEVEMTRAGFDRERLVCTLTDRTRHVDLQQMELLSEIAALEVRELGLSELGEQVVEAVVAYLDADFAVLTHHEDDQLVPVAWRGVMLDPEMRVDVHRHPGIEELLQNQKPGRIDNWPWRRQKGDSLKQIVVPLIGPEARVGTLHLGYASEFDGESFGLGLDALDRAFTETLGRCLRAAMESALHSEETTSIQHQLRGLLEAIPEGVLLYDQRGEVSFFNEAIVEATGFDGWQNLNTDSRPFRILSSSGEPLPRSEWPFFRAVREDDHCRSALVLDFGHGRRDVLVDAAPLRCDGDAERLYLGTIRDVTEQRKLNRRKDEFLSIASHELRSPLTPLTGVLQLARRQRERGDAVDLSLLTRAERQVSRLTRLIDGLLDLTRIETGRIELETRRVQFVSFIENRIQPWRHHPKEVDLEVEMPDEEIAAEIDPERINQVLTNVVDNAIKYSKSNETICIEVSDAGSRVVVAVEDDGVGMDEETVDRIFDRFYHGGDDRGGARSMGLGLYICRQIVEQHDGEISVESEKDVGTRVEIALPKHQPRSGSGDP